MPVAFVTHQGRCLRNDDMTAKDVEESITFRMSINGYEYGNPTALVVHVSTKFIVEWWDT